MAWKQCPSYIWQSVLAIYILASILILLGQPPVYKVSGLSSALKDLSFSPRPDVGKQAHLALIAPRDLVMTLHTAAALD
jgi:hypothetical protein